MTMVTLHVYDVTNSGNKIKDDTIVQINNFFRVVFGLGGIFHCAVQVYEDKEWSFGFCEQGTGVYDWQTTKNPMFKFRESILLGQTFLSFMEVNQILLELRMEWHGNSYDLLSNNCNHFCDKFVGRLGVQSSLPGWVNRFADTAEEIAGDADRFGKTKTEKIINASKAAFRHLAGVPSNNSGGTQDSDGNSNRDNPRFPGTWVKKFITPGAKPSSSSMDPDNK